jgi:hypothetical protein
MAWPATQVKDGDIPIVLQYVVLENFGAAARRARRVMCYIDLCKSLAAATCTKLTN